MIIECHVKFKDLMWGPKLIKLHSKRLTCDKYKLNMCVRTNVQVYKIKKNAKKNVL